MKICTYHLDSLRTALAKHGLFSNEPFFRAQALLLANATQHNPDFAIAHAHDHCPICIFMVPSWIDNAAQSVAETEDVKPS